MEKYYDSVFKKVLNHISLKFSNMRECEIEDIVSECMIKIFTKGYDIKSEAALFKLCALMATRKTIDLFRYRSNHPVYLVDAPSDPNNLMFNSIYDNGFLSKYGVDHIHMIYNDYVRPKIQGEEVLKVMDMFIYQGMTVAEIAPECNITYNAVGSNLTRYRRLIRETMLKYDNNLRSLI